jgi:hypothetical protein
LNGLEEFLVHPTLSVVLSFLLVRSIYLIGLICNYYLLKNNFQNLYFFPIGYAILVSLFGPIFILGYLNYFVLKTIGLILIAFSIINFILKINYYHNLIKLNVEKISLKNLNQYNNFYLLSIFLLFLYLLLTLSPIVDPDSLDYHVGMAIQLLNNGTYPPIPEWFHSRLAGSGEVMIALGLAIGAEQFGSLCQFMALVTIYCLVIGSPGNKNKILLGLIILSCPVLIPWVSTPKPFLMPIALIAIAFVILSNYLKISQNKNNLKIINNSNFIILILCVIVAASSKLNFLMSATIIIIFSYLTLNKKVGSLKFILFLILFSIMAFLPFSYIRYLNYGGSILTALISPFSGDLPGMIQFREGLTGYKESFIKFPFSLIYSESLSSISTTLGIAPILAIIILIKRFSFLQNKILLLIPVFIFVVGAIIGQKTSRFFLEALVLLVIYLSYNLSDIVFEKYLKIVIIIQSVVVIFFLSYGISILSYGFLSVDFHKKVMEKNAYSFRELQWANSIIPDNAVVISEYRTLSLINRKTISNDWYRYVDNSQDINLYEDIIMKKTPNFIIMRSESNNLPNLKCGASIYAGPFESTFAARNPFNRGLIYYTWILFYDKNSCNK